MLNKTMLTRQKFPFIPPKTKRHLKIPHRSLIQHQSQWKIIHVRRPMLNKTMLTRQKFPFIPPKTTRHLKISHGSLIQHQSQWKIIRVGRPMLNKTMLTRQKISFHSSRNHTTLENSTWKSYITSKSMEDHTCRKAHVKYDNVNSSYFLYKKVYFYLEKKNNLLYFSKFN